LELKKKLIKLKKNQIIIGFERKVIFSLGLIGSKCNSIWMFDFLVTKLHKYHYGYTQPNGNAKLYVTLIKRLQDIYNTKCLYNSKAHASGCIINTCGWVRNQGYEMLLEIAKSFEADVVLCLDTEKLYHDLKRDLPNFVNIMQLPKSPGVQPRNKDQRREIRDFQIRQYFEGASLDLHPHSYDVRFTDFEIYKIGAPALPESALPIGTVREDTRTQLVKLSESQYPDLINHLLSINHAQSLNENLIETNVCGFVLVKNVNLEKGTITIKSPESYPLPGRYFVQTNIRYMDHT
jgi:polyribonucleotide 5'-hydroxyl-kinase